jgi:MoaA/NifB/PqqE/SkfB family radical SAM enzyme
MEYFQALVRPENRLDALIYNLTLSDPIYSGVLLDQLEYISNLDNPPRIFISTNGSGRNEKYWRRLAELLKPNDVVEFAVDGLEDTNHIYRVNAKYDTIINGMQWLKKYGKCNVGWRFIVFEHNYHQVEQAKEQAKLLHLDRFHVILGDNRTPDSMKLKSVSFDDIS